MFVHSVYFWLKADLPAADREQFLSDLKALEQIESLRFFSIGTPADTNRPIIDRSYSYALITAFDDQAGHDAYQVHPVHDRFRRNAHCWEKIVIYDAV